MKTDTTCEHGRQFGVSGVPAGGWSGPVGKCGCCRSTFVYLEHGSISSSGHSAGKFWSPKDRCGGCGGSCHEYGSTVAADSPGSRQVKP